MSASRVWKLSDINMLDIGARDGERDQVLRLAGGGAGVTAYAARVVYDFAPLNLLALLPCVLDW
jgi:hypothetical protein